MDIKKLTPTEAGIIAMLQDGPADPITLLRAGSFDTVNKAIGTLKAKGLIEEVIQSSRVYLQLTDDSQKEQDAVK